MVSPQLAFRFALVYSFGYLCGTYLNLGHVGQLYYRPRCVPSACPNDRYFTNNLTTPDSDIQKNNLLEKGNASILQHELVEEMEKHHDDDSVARKLLPKVKILVWVMTTKANHEKKCHTVKNTWGKHCEKLLFMSDTEDKTLPAIAVYSEAGRGHLTGKTMRSFDYLYKHHLNDYDWFMKADDDTYVVMENLRYMLSGEDPTKPIYFGHHFKPYVKQGYFSGGGGYVISKEALRRFGTRDSNSCALDGGAEDIMFGRCMEKLGVIPSDSRDSLNRTRFHCFSPEMQLKGRFPNWFHKYNKFEATGGEEAISDYAITFHYLSPEKMMNMEFSLYHLRPYGIKSGLQDLNRHR